MSIDRTRPRPDVGYLRRRPRRDDKPTAPAAAAAQPSTAKPTKPPRLSLRGPGAPPTPPTPAAPTSPAPAPASAPPAPPPRRSSSRPAKKVSRATGRIILNADTPTVTLDRRQSAIGSLLVEMSPAWPVSCVWELLDGTAGVVSASTGVRVSAESNNRPLVELRDDRLLIGLRHIRELRRLLIVAHDPELGGPPGTAILTLYDDTTVESTHDGAAPIVVSIAAYQVHGELVLRREGASFPTLDAATHAYGFAATWRPLPGRG